MAQQHGMPRSNGPIATVNRPSRGSHHSAAACTPGHLEPATVAELLNAYRQQNLGTLLSVLTRRPEEFTRQLGRLTRLFPQHVPAIAEAFTSVGRALPIDELVRLHNRYSNAARGVGEHLSMDNYRFVHLIQSPALSRDGAAQLLLAVELCLSGRMSGLTVSMPTTDAFSPAEQAQNLGSCNPALDGALNAFEPSTWEPFRLDGTEIILATGVRDIPDGYGLSLWLLDDDYRCRARIERGAPRVCVASFYDEEISSRTVDAAGLKENYRIEEFAELDYLNAMDRQVRYVAVIANTSDPILPTLEVPDCSAEASTSPFRGEHSVLPDVRSAGVTASGNLHTVAHRGMLPVLTAPGRTVSAVLDLYKQRISLPGVGIPRGLSLEDEERTMGLLLSALNGYLPLTNRALMRLAGAAVEVR